MTLVRGDRSIYVPKIQSKPNFAELLDEIIGHEICGILIKELLFVAVLPLYIIYRIIKFCVCAALLFRKSNDINYISDFVFYFNSVCYKCYVSHSHYHNCKGCNRAECNLVEIGPRYETFYVDYKGRVVVGDITEMIRLAEIEAARLAALNRSND